MVFILFMLVNRIVIKINWINKTLEEFHKEISFLFLFRGKLTTPLNLVILKTIRMGFFLKCYTPLKRASKSPEHVVWNAESYIFIIGNFRVIKGITYVVICYVSL